MQNLRPRLLALATFTALFITGPVVAVAQTIPDYLPPQYRPFFKHFEVGRSLPEQWLNRAGLTSSNYGRGFALIAGVSKYPRMAGPAGNLVPAAEDVRKLESYLKTYEKIDEIVVLTDEQVTEENLAFFLEKYFPQRIKEFPKSRFLFAYSGHGTTQNDKGYLLTSGARSLTDTFNSIPMITLRAMFQQVVDEGFHVVALINACYSGDFIKRSLGNTQFIPRNPGAHAIVAGGTKELTWHDGTVGTGSVFFEKFFAALDGRASRDGIVTVNELYAYLQREVQITTDPHQNPLAGDLSRDGSLGGFFFFNRQPLVEAKFLPGWDARRGVPFGDPLPEPAVGVFPPESGLYRLTAARQHSLKAKDMLKECEACPEMVVVPSGSFMMGSPANEQGRANDEGPQHRVTFRRPFAVGKFAVTFDEWGACVADGGCRRYRLADQGRGREKWPVTTVSWNDAKAYVAWLSGKTSKNYRLLSEAEREYVTRAGTTTPFWWGTSIATSQANYNGKAFGGSPKGENRQESVPVDWFEPNPWGLYQVHGNVFEWVEDCHHASYRGAPADGSAWTKECVGRVLRGGSWDGDPQILRSAARIGAHPDERAYDVGFRVARTLTP